MEDKKLEVTEILKPYQKKVEYMVIVNAVNTLSVLCAANGEKIIELLNLYLFDKKETEELLIVYKKIHGN